MASVVLRVRLRDRLIYAVFGSAVIVLTCWVCAPVLWDFISTFESKVPWLIWVVIAGAVIWIFDLFLWGYSVLFQWKCRLEFDDTHLLLRVIPHPTVRSYRVAYSDIVQVKRKAHGLLLIVPRNGKPLRLGANGFEGGTKALLAELSKHIPPERFEPDLEVALRRYTWRERALIGVFVVLLLAEVGTCLGTWGKGLLLDQVAWTTGVPLDWHQSVTAFTFDRSGTLWMVVKTFPTDSQEVWRMGAEKVTQWSVPPMVTLTGKSDDIFQVVSHISIDANGYPWLVFGENLFRWTGEDWERVDIGEGWLRKTIAGSRQMWVWNALAGKAASPFVGVDITSGYALPVALPEPAVKLGMKITEIRTAVDGSALVLASGKDQCRLYFFDDGQWHENVLTFDTLKSCPDEFTLDPQGHVWVLSLEDINQNTNDYTYKIGKHDFDSQAWTWYTVTLSSKDALNGYHSIQSLTVDGRERLWLRADRQVDVWEPLADGTLQRIVQYTSENSGYPGYGNNLYQNRDGRIWIAGGKLAWIDSNAENLPRPLPDWISGLTSRSSADRFWLPLMVGALVALIVCAIWVYR
jgi:hypothetical protein